MKYRTLTDVDAFVNERAVAAVAERYTATMNRMRAEKSAGRPGQHPLARKRADAIANEARRQEQERGNSAETRLADTLTLPQQRSVQARLLYSWIETLERQHAMLVAIPEPDDDITEAITDTAEGLAVVVAAYDALPAKYRTEIEEVHRET